MRFYFDTEFIDVSRKGRVEVYLLSIGIVADNGATYYAVNKHAPHDLADQWVRENVLPHLRRGDAQPIDVIRDDIKTFVETQNATDPHRPEFWAYYADYDWTLLCSIFGGMLSLPTGWPMLCMDLKQEALQQGVRDLPQPELEHDALSDAIAVKRGYEVLFGVTHDGEVT